MDTWSGPVYPLKQYSNKPILYRTRDEYRNSFYTSFTIETYMKGPNWSPTRPRVIDPPLNRLATDPWTVQTLKLRDFAHRRTCPPTLPATGTLSPRLPSPCTRGPLVSPVGVVRRLSPSFVSHETTQKSKTLRGCFWGPVTDDDTRPRQFKPT